MRLLYTPVRTATNQRLTLLARMWDNMDSHVLLVGRHLGRFLQNNILFPYDPAASHAPWCFPKEGENMCQQKNLHTDIYCIFIYNCQNSEATIRPSVSEWIHKVWYIQATEECYSALKSSELSSCERLWRKRKCMWPSERSQSERATKCEISTLWHSGKGKTGRDWNERWLPGFPGQGWGNSVLST